MSGSAASRAVRALAVAILTVATLVALLPGQAAAGVSFTVSRVRVDFGDVAVGSSETDAVTISNVGTTTFSVHATTDPNPPFSAADGSCDDRFVAPGSFCTVFVTFSPTAPGFVDSGPRGTAHMRIFVSELGGLAVVGHQDVFLSGNGVIPRAVTLTPTCGPASPEKTTVTATVTGFTAAATTGQPKILFEVLGPTGAFVFRDAHTAVATANFGFTAIFGLKQPAGAYTVRATEDTSGNRLADAGEPTASATFTIPCAAGSGGDPAPALHQARLYALLSGISFEGTTAASIEIVSLAAMTRLATVPLGSRLVQAFAIAPDGSRAYVADAAGGGKVATVDLASGEALDLSVPGVRDLVLSPDGTVLYVTTSSKVQAYDTTTAGLTLLRELAAQLGPSERIDFLGSVALSPNAQTLAVVVSDGAMYLVRASDLALLARVPITNPGEPSNCTTLPNDAAFAGDGTVLLWDANCDNVYEVQVLTQTQNTAATIRLGRDDGSSFNYNNALSYSAVANAAYTHTEGIGIGGTLRGHAGIFDRAGLAAASIFGLGGTPFSSALTPDGTSLFVDVIDRFVLPGTADRLDRYDTLTKKYYRGVYVFSDATMSARDMKILPAQTGISVVARCGVDGPVLPGITARLVQDGVVIATTITTSEGLAIFPTALPGTYSVILTKADGTQCIVGVTLEGDGDQVATPPASCTPSNTWLNAASLTTDGTPADAVLCAGGHLWYRLVTDGSPVVPQLSRIVAYLTGPGGGALLGDLTLMLLRDPMLALRPVTSPSDAHTRFAGDTFGGDTFGGDTFGGDTFGGDTFGGDTFGGDTFGGDTFGGDTFGGDTFGGDTFGGDTFGGDTFGGDTFGGDTFGGDTFGGDTFGGVFALAGGDPRAYAAAIARSVVRVAAHAGTSPEGLWQNTWNNRITWYLRVSSAGGSGPFHLRAKVFTGQCSDVDPTLAAFSSAVPAGGTFETLILRNSAFEGGNSAAVGTALQALAQHPTVKGYIADLAGDLAGAHAQLAGNAFCPNAANVVADSARAYVRAFHAAHPELRSIVIAADDEGIPQYRVPDLSTLAPQNMLVLPLRPQMVEGELRLNFFGTDDAYGDWDPVEKLDHLLFIPEVPVGRMDPAYVPTLVQAYLAAGGLITASDAAVTGYNFWNDVAVSIRDQLIATGQQVNAFQSATKPLIQSGQGLPTDPDAWGRNELIEAFEADTDIFVLFAHGLRASEIAPADYTAPLTAAQAIALGEANPLIKRLKLLISGACNFALGVPGGQSIPGVTPTPELAEIGQALGWLTVAWDSYAYGDDERIAYSEELADDLLRELTYGTGPVRLGEALVRVKRAWAARQTDLTGIQEKSLMGMVIQGLPMTRVDLGTTGRGTRPGDLADFTSDDLVPVPGGSAGSNAALGLRTRDITLDFTQPAHLLARFDRTLANVDATGTPTGGSTVASYWAVTTPANAQGFVQATPGQQLLPRWSVPLHPSDLANDSSLFARGVTLLSASCTRTSPFTPLVSRTAYQLAPPAGPFITDRYLPNDWWEINYLDPTREFLLVRPAQYRSAINATTGQPETFGTSKTFTNVTFRAWYGSLLTETITDSNSVSMQAILAGPPEFLSRTVTPSADGGSIAFDVRVSVLPNVGVQEVTVLWQDGAPNAPCAISSFSLAQDPNDGQRWTGTLVLPQGTSASTVSYALQAVSGAGRVRVADNFGQFYPAQPGPTLTAPLADTSLALIAPTPSTAVSGRTIMVAAELRRAGTNTLLGGRRVDFRLSGLNGDRAFGFTDANGVARATLEVDALPGALSVWAEFGGAAGLRGSSASAAITVQKETSALSGLTVAPATQQDSDAIDVTARLSDGLGRRLREQSVLFLVTGAGCATYAATDAACAVVQAQAAETDFAGVARSRIALATGAGAFRVHAAFAGTIVLPSGVASPPTITLDLQNARYEPARLGTGLAVTAEGVTVTYTGDTLKAAGQPLSLSATVVEEADGSLGTITPGGSLATFTIVGTNGAVIGTAFGSITPTGPGSADVTASIPSGLAAGVYTIVVDVSGARQGGTTALLAVYDAAAGHVTGGGWIATAGGRANLGFVAKYQKDATTPTGQTQFQVKDGLRFHSTSYEWLVIAGSRAQYQGSGAVNGSGDHGFMVTVTDGAPDRFRIQIWDKATGATIYDTQPGAPADAAPSTALGGGSIVIHR